MAPHNFFWQSDDTTSNDWFPSKNEAIENAVSEGYALTEFTVLSVKDDFREILDNLSDGIYDDEAYLLFISEIVGWDYLTTSYYSWDDFESAFNDSYGGEYDSPEDWAENFINDCYGDVFSLVSDSMGQTMAYYVTFDYALFARDAESGGDEHFIEIPGGGGIYVFHSNF